MKKLFTLVLVCALSAGLAFAQTNNAKVEQDGNQNDATIDQVGDRHEAKAYQGVEENARFGIAVNNEVSITQKGAEAGGYVFQGLDGQR